jgi:glycosyltransferase involved in cell wall biosynthesis
MKISIITISFNQKKYLQQCIESVLGQTGCDLEYIVVDPGSSDGSRELIESYGEKIIKVFEIDKGPADGLNRGFSRATGDVYGFVNSDDYLLPNALAHITNYFHMHGPQIFVTGQGSVEDAQGRQIRLKPQQLTVANMLHRSAVLFQQGTFFPAALYAEVGGFNVKNTTCWDYELFLKFLLRGVQHAVIDQDVAVFRLHDGSISGSGRLTQRYLKELDRIFIECCGRERGVWDKAYTFALRLKRVLTYVAGR